MSQQGHSEKVTDEAHPTTQLAMRVIRPLSTPGCPLHANVRNPRLGARTRQIRRLRLRSWVECGRSRLVDQLRCLAVGYVV